jgi:predicted transcriptional regulator
MEAQNIYTKKMALFSYIASVEDDSMIDKLLQLINPSDNTTKKKNDATLKLSAAQKSAIDKGLKDIEDGNIIPYKQAREELKKRMPTYFK